MSNWCKSSPCVNGRCENIKNGYICKCQKEFTGRICEKHRCNGFPSWTLYGNSCFNCRGDKRTWQNARADCHLEGADLVSITNAGIQGFVQNFCSFQQSWIGFNDIQRENNFIWLDGSKLGSFTNWNPGEPNDMNGEDCTIMFGTNGLWNDMDCSANLTYMCQKSADLDDCLSSPCKNGTCVDLFGTYQCICQPDFTGNNCDIDINECQSSPCLHGNCTDHVNKYECSCYPGYTGTNCATDIDECSSSPCLHGSCIDQVNAYSCICQQVYTGTNCQIDVNECISSPCSHGQCVDKINSFTCDCWFGYEGTICEEYTDECLSSPCGNGTCVDLFGTYKCICEAEFTGNNCDKDMNECRSSPCVHGSCVNLINGFECHCQPGFTGKRCEHDIDECSSSPCLQGTCIDLVNAYKCVCRQGYSGTNCEKGRLQMIRFTKQFSFSQNISFSDIDECSSSPCLQGTCIDLANAYKCVCRQGYSGTNCEIGRLQMIR
ncbi:fibropellin-1-like [Saccostrea cucullata]|uniref:fibropellin-1-like n=1 Tax=Saccostrea cuccullata TaxID=36930 RepID=UPI002ED137A3